MNSKALVLAAATVGVTVVTFVALNLAAPISHAEETRPEGITAEQVFSSSIADAGDATPANTAFQSEGQMEVAVAQDAGGEAAPEAAPAPSEAPSAPAIAGGSCAMGVSGGTPVVVPAAGLPGGPAAGSGAEPMEVAQAEMPAAEPAAEPAPAPAPEAAPMDAAPAESAPMEAAAMPAEESHAAAGGEVTEAAGACATGLHDPNAKPIVVVAQGVPGGPAAPPSDGGMAPPAPAEVAAVEPGDAAPAPEPAAPPPAPEPAPAPAEPEPKAEPAPAPAPKSEPAPAPKPKAAPKPAEKPKPKSAAPKVAPPEAKVAWWPAKEAGKLNVVYAGEASFTKAIVVMFDGQFDNADSANQNIKVTPKKGGQVNGQWMVAKGNPSMLLLNVDPGLYSVDIGGGLTDKGGRAVSKASSGVVFVH